MKTSVLIGFLLLQSLALGHTPPRWDFPSAYKSSKDVFIAEVIEAETSLEIESGQYAKNMETGEVGRLVWTDSKRYKLSVREVFKSKQPKVFEVYNYGGAGIIAEEYQGDQGDLWRIWNSGEGFGSNPRPVLGKGNQYLFFLNRKDGGEVTEIHSRSAHPVESMNEVLWILRAMSSGGPEVGFDEALKLHEDRMQELEAKKAENDGILRAEYHAILNTNPDLAGGKKKLIQLIKKLGFDELWHEANSSSRKDSYPPKTIEKEIWYNASQEIRKIEMILAARAAKESE